MPEYIENFTLTWGGPFYRGVFKAESTVTIVTIVTFTNYNEIYIDDRQKVKKLHLSICLYEAVSHVGMSSVAKSKSATNLYESWNICASYTYIFMYIQQC